MTKIKEENGIWIKKNTTLLQFDLCISHGHTPISIRYFNKKYHFRFIVFESTIALPIAS